MIIIFLINKFIVLNQFCIIRQLFECCFEFHFVPISSVLCRLNVSFLFFVLLFASFVFFFRVEFGRDMSKQQRGFAYFSSRRCRYGVMSFARTQHARHLHTSQHKNYTVVFYSRSSIFLFCCDCTEVAFQKKLVRNVFFCLQIRIACIFIQL